MHQKCCQNSASNQQSHTKATHKWRGLGMLQCNDKFVIFREICTVTHQVVELENDPEQSAESRNRSSADHLDASAYFLACLGHI